MRNIIQDSIQQVTQSAKIATASSITTAGTAGVTWLEWIPEDIGKLAILVSLTLSIVLAYNHVMKNKREKKEHELKVKLMEKELNE